MPKCAVGLLFFFFFFFARILYFTNVQCTLSYSGQQCSRGLDFIVELFEPVRLCRVARGTAVLNSCCAFEFVRKQSLHLRG
jgi:hypothetical protein